MSDIVLLVDYENVGKVDLGAVPSGVRVPFFFGASQKSVSTDFLKAALKLGDRFMPIDIHGHGRNALDFHIAFYVGEYLAKSPQTACIVLSKDKGFDPLIKHLADRGFKIRRAATLEEAFTTSIVKPATAKKVTPQPVGDPWETLLVWLSGIEKGKRPRRRKGLVAHLHARVSKKMSEAELQAFVDRLIAQGKLSEVNGTITYHF